MITCMTVMFVPVSRFFSENDKTDKHDECDQCNRAKHD